MLLNIGVERAINSVLRVMVFVTTIIVGIAIMAVIFDFDTLKANLFSKGSETTGRSSVSAYHVDVGWALLLGQEKQNIKFSYIKDDESDAESVIPSVQDEYEIRPQADSFDADSFDAYISELESISIRL